MLFGELFPPLPVSVAPSFRMARLARLILPMATFPVIGGFAQSKGLADPAPLPNAANSAQIVENYGKLPLSFETNRGQVDKSVKFLSRGDGYSLALTDAGAVLALTRANPAAKRVTSVVGQALRHIPSNTVPKTDVVWMRLAGASPAAEPAGLDPLPGTANYFIGNDPAKWHSDVPTFAKVRYASVYPGVDLVFYGNQRQLEYDFAVKAGADPGRIRLRFAGAKGLRLSEDGGLEIATPHGTVKFRRPVVYQVRDGRREPVDGRFELMAGKTAGFTLGAFDRGLPLVIDPTLEYSTLMGAVTGPTNSNGGEAKAIAVDAKGNVYIAGVTSSIYFPVTKGAFQTQSADGALNQVSSYPFVTKLDPTGSKLTYSTYLGGSGYVYFNRVYGFLSYSDSVSSIAIDAAGNAYVAGQAYSANFPVSATAFQKTNKSNLNGGTSGYVTKLNAKGNGIVYSTYLGGSGSRLGEAIEDECAQVTVDAAGNAYVVGTTPSKDFPVTKGAFETTLQGFGNVFVTKLNPAGSGLVYSTYLGGSNYEFGNAIAVDGKGEAYVGGLTYSTNFPVSSNAFQTTNFNEVAQHVPAGFVARLNAKGSALAYATYLGGAGGTNHGGDAVTGVAVDSAYNAYVTGVTGSIDFPTTPGALQTAHKVYTCHCEPATFDNAFVTKINPEGTRLVFSTYLGSSDGEYPATGTHMIALDKKDNVYVTGATYGIDFPVSSNAVQAVNNSAGHGGRAKANANAYVTELSTTGALVFSTYLGGSGVNTRPTLPPFDASYAADFGSSLGLDAAGNVYVAGIAQSNDFPVTAGAYQTTKTSQVSAFVSKLNLATAEGDATLTTIQSNLNPQSDGKAVTFTARVQSTSGNGIPTGTVDFDVTGGTSGSGTLNAAGTATYSISSLSDGAHKVTAKYLGDGHHAGSSGSLNEVMVGQAATIAVLSGGNQTTGQGSAFPARVVVVVKDADGNPIPNDPVSFGGAGLYYSTGSVTTSFNGQAAVVVFSSAAGNLTGTAKVGGVTAPAFFSLHSLQLAATPVISPGTGTYKGKQTVHISDAMAATTIYYTLDGSTPTKASHKYTNAGIAVTKTVTIHAMATATGFANSQVATATLTIQ